MPAPHTYAASLSEDELSASQAPATTAGALRGTEASQPEGEPDYRAMDACDMLAAVGDDAKKWADAYCQIWPNGCADHATMIGWFANAIEYSSDVRRWRAEKEAAS